MKRKRKNFKTIVELASRVAEGEDKIEEGAVGWLGHAFIFKKTEFFFEPKERVTGSGVFHITYKNIEHIIETAARLKTLIPDIKLGGDEILFDVSLFVKTPNDKKFLATFYFRKFSLGIGTLVPVGEKDPNVNICLNNPEKNYPKNRIWQYLNYSAKSLTREEKLEFCKALDLALVKVPKSIFKCYLTHDFGISVIGFDGKTLSMREDTSGEYRGLDRTWAYTMSCNDRYDKYYYNYFHIIHEHITLDDYKKYPEGIPKKVRKKIIERYYDEFLEYVFQQDSRLAYIALGVFLMRFGAIIIEDLKQEILKYSDWEWEKVQLEKRKDRRERKKYLKEFRIKLKNYTAEKPVEVTTIPIEYPLEERKNIDYKIDFEVDEKRPIKKEEPSKDYQILERMLRMNSIFYDNREHKFLGIKPSSNNKYLSSKQYEKHLINKQKKDQAAKSELSEKDSKALRDLERVLDNPIPVEESINEKSFGVEIEYNKIISLGLYNCELKSLPESIGNLTSLVSLFLVDNQLKALPEFLGNLTELIVLDLTNNPIKSLPKSFQKLHSIIDFCINDYERFKYEDSIRLIGLINHFYYSKVDIPTEILADLIGKFNIKNLNKKYYEFPDAKLHYFVDFLDFITEKENFDYYGNLISPLFQKINYLKFIEEDYDFLDIEAFLKILKKPHVKNLECTKNTKKEIVDDFFNEFRKDREIGKFKLIILIHDEGDEFIRNLIKSNFLEIIKTDGEQSELLDYLIQLGLVEIFTESELGSFNIKRIRIDDGYPIGDLRKIPKEIGYINSLEEIRIYQDNYKNYQLSLPDTIKNLKNLKILDLSGLQDLLNLSESLLELKNLKIINLPTYCARYQVPDWIHKLNWLEELNLYVCHYWADCSMKSLQINLINYFDKLNGSELCSFIKLLWKYKKINSEKQNKLKELLIDLETDFSRKKFEEIINIIRKDEGKTNKT